MQTEHAGKDVVLPHRLQHLAALLGPALGGPASAFGPVDADLIRLAIHRHQVGPMLQAVLRRGREVVAEPLMRELVDCRARNADRQVSDLARLHAIADIFAGRGISWLSLKGTPQAARLYGDPSLRPSSDIDILVAPRDFVRAVTALAENGYIPSNPPVPAGQLRALVLAAVRDVSLIAGDDHRCAVELHRRLFLAVGARTRRLRLTPDTGVLPTPCLDADLACYLILHGAQSYWVRLKWLADLVPLLAILGDQDKQTVIVRAQQVGAESSVAASLLLLRMLFPFASLGPLAPWLEMQERRQAVRRRLLRYARMIGMEDDWKHSPLDNARITMQAYMSLFEAPSTRACLVPVALFSSVVRRTAGMMWPAARALTRDDNPPPGRPVKSAASQLR
jgi:putative nucleotidyltransferase-like protein